jgi:hypothetical protein
VGEFLEAVVVLLRSERHHPPTVLAPTVLRPIRTHGMAQKKKGTGTSARKSDNQALITVSKQNQTTTKEGEVYEVANGQFEVQLQGLGVPAEDIAVHRRIEARLEEVATRAREAARVVQPSTLQHNTRSKASSLK